MKAPTTQPARTLYTSPLFAKRRAAVERSCDAWWILSAAHGLVEPDRMLAPYDQSLNSMGRSARRAWAEKVLTSIDAEVGLHPGDVVEVHAGAAYLDFGLFDGLEARVGAGEVLVPTRGLSIGRQLAFYGTKP